MDAALADATRLPDGPVGMQIALAAGPGRRWTNLWEGTIDGLAPLLGSAYTDRPWNRLDGRNVRLALHRTDDRALGHDIAAVVWAAPAAADWPETVRRGPSRATTARKCGLEATKRRRSVLRLYEGGPLSMASVCPNPAATPRNNLI